MQRIILKRALSWRTASVGVSVAAMLTLGACANPWQEFQAGASESALVAKLGPPK